MAKRKHAAALFEVINHTDKRMSSRSSASPAASISAWFRKRSAAKAARPAPVAKERAHSGPSMLSTMFSKFAGFIPSKPRVAMNLDPDRQIVSFRLSYTTALIAAFCVVAVIALAFVVGKHATRRVTPALADMTTDELRNGPAQPDVLDVGSDSAPMALAANNVAVGHTPGTPAATPVKPAAPQSSSPQSPSQSAPSPVAPKPGTVDPGAAQTANVKSDADREEGRQYVVMQCYPEPEKQMAEDACKYLTKNGVPCTVEFNTSYANGWYAVVGIAGFGHIRNTPEYDAYIARITQLSDAFAARSRFKRFDPKPYKWRKQSKAVG